VGEPRAPSAPDVQPDQDRQDSPAGKRPLRDTLPLVAHPGRPARRRASLRITPLRSWPIEHAGHQRSTAPVEMRSSSPSSRSAIVPQPSSNSSENRAVRGRGLVIADTLWAKQSQRLVLTISTTGCAVPSSFGSTWTRDVSARARNDRVSCPNPASFYAWRRVASTR
jgi:hypothetical protein